MKKMILCACVCLGLAGSVAAQTKQKKPVRKAATQKTTTVRKTAPKPQTAAINLNSSSSYTAKTINTTGLRNYRFLMTDTVAGRFNLMNAPQVNNAEVLGMPKGAYGFANGRIRLGTTGSTTSGTSTGTGNVGTGSSLGTMGSTGAGIGLNGKSPSAGSTMWGNARGMQLHLTDSTNKQ